MGAIELCPRCGAQRASGTGPTGVCPVCAFGLALDRDPTNEPTETSEPDRSAPSRTVGPYRLLEKIGEGGMGEVWRAEQTAPVRRMVALKLIKPGMDSRQVIARFEAERQALAMMDHPSVSGVLDAGSTDDGRPFFVMEYIAGIPITEHCDRSSLTTSERIELFLKVCDGVQHAHQRAIIHRDLKPSNVLVSVQDGVATPKIIDFGVAKATAVRLTERSMFTEVGSLIGTPEYMSPEQADLTAQDVDTRTDVYALGVMLYELLVGELPFEPEAFRQAGFDGIRRMIREIDPPTPSARLGTLAAGRSSVSAKRRRVDLPTLRRQISGELDWITMKALEKDRARRYQSPADLAADLARHLHHEPVAAAPPSAAYRARKFVRRHRVGVGFAAAGALGLAVFAAAMAFQTARIAKERDRANREATTANRALQVLTDVFEISDPSAARGRTITAREVLDGAASTIDEELREEPLVRAKLLFTIGRVYRNLGLYDSARPALESSLQLRREQLGDRHADTLTTINELAGVLEDQGKLTESERYFREALEGRRRVLGTDHNDTLTSVNNLAVLLRKQGKLEEAERYFRETLDARRRILGDDHVDVLTSMNNLAEVLRVEGKLDEAEPYQREVLERCRRTMGNDDPKTLTALSNFGLLLNNQGRLAEAEPFLREALETRRRVLGNEHRQTLISIDMWGGLLRAEGRLAEAEPYIREAVDGSRRVLGENHPNTLGVVSGLGLLLRAQGELQGAEAALREALDGRRRILGDDHPETVVSIINLASVLHDRGKLDEAEALMREALERGRRALRPDHPATLNAMTGLGDVFTSRGRPDDALPLIDEALAGARRSLPPGHKLIGRALCHQGRCLTALGRHPEAEVALLAARDNLTRSDAVSLPLVVTNLANLYTSWGKPEKAAAVKAAAGS